jgi:hypothetical protein
MLCVCGPEPRSPALARSLVGMAAVSGLARDNLWIGGHELEVGHFAGCMIGMFWHDEVKWLVGAEERYRYAGKRVQ